MPFVQLVLSTQELERLVIGMDNKLLWKEIMAPCLEDSDESVELLVVGRVVELGSSQLLAKISDGPALL